MKITLALSGVIIGSLILFIALFAWLSPFIFEREGFQPIERMSIFRTDNISFDFLKLSFDTTSTPQSLQIDYSVLLKDHNGTIAITLPYRGEVYTQQKDWIVKPFSAETSTVIMRNFTCCNLPSYSVYGGELIFRVDDKLDSVHNFIHSIELPFFSNPTHNDINQYIFDSSVKKGTNPRNGWGELNHLPQIALILDKEIDAWHGDPTPDQEPFPDRSNNGSVKVLSWNITKSNQLFTATYSNYKDRFLADNRIIVIEFSLPIGSGIIFESVRRSRKESKKPREEITGNSIDVEKTFSRVREQDEVKNKEVEPTSPHKQQLFDDLMKALGSSGFVWSLGWCDFFDSFLQGKNFLQHLHTGYPEIFSSLQSYMETRKQNKKLPDEEARIRQKIVDKVTKTLSIISETHSRTFQQSIVECILHSNDANKIEFKPLYNDYFKNWGVTFNNIEYVEAISDEKVANNIASKLNEIIHSEDISKTLSRFRELPKEMNIKFGDFKKILDEKLIIKIHGKTSELEGVCKECLKFYEKDPKYNELRAKLESFKNPCESFAK